MELLGARTARWAGVSFRSALRGADVSPPGWNQGRSDFDVFERPVPEARHAWFGFFRPDCDWLGQPASGYLRNRIARLTSDLKTGEAQIQR